MPRLPPLHLVTMGRPAALVDGAPAPATVLWHTHFALLVYLALSPDLSRSRAHLMTLLWPERPDARARHSLNEAVHRLRACLGPDRLLTDGEAVSLSREQLTVDAWNHDPAAGGEFLDSFVLEDSQPFEEWLERERRRRRGDTVAALVGAARRLLAGGMPARAVAAARAARAQDPVHETALRVLMEALALQGDSGGALAELRDYRQRLADLNEQPSPALTGLAQRIGSASRPMAGAVAVGDPGLVGRATALARLIERLPLPGGTPARVLLVLGEGGEGKTRMLRELERRATLAGITIASARALPSDQGRPGSALRGLFRGGLLRAPGLLGVEAAHLRRLASVVPELGERFPAQAAMDDGELAFALAEALDATAGEAPLLLLLDDAHLADGASIGVLHAALARLPDPPVTLALTAAPRDPDAAPELLRLAAETGRGLPGTTVTLGPLGLPEVTALVEELAPWAAPGEPRDRLGRRLVHETSGNPFLVVTLLRALADVADLQAQAVQWPPTSETLDSPLPLAVPPLIQSGVLAQAARLDQASLEVLAVAATLGTEVEATLLAGVTGLSEGELAHRLALPERLQLIAATERGYGFPGVIVAAVLHRAGITPGRRREVRRRAAELLALRGDPASRLARLELLAQVMPAVELAAEAVELGELLLAQGDRHAARRAGAIASGPGAALPEPTRRAWRALRERLDGQATEPGGTA